MVSRIAIVLRFQPVRQILVRAPPQLRAMPALPRQRRVKGSLNRHRAIARRAKASPISTKAEVTSGPPTRIRVGVFILFHS